MALVALNRTFVFEVMAGNTDFVRDVLVPAINNSNPGLVAVEAVIMHIRLVLPMLESEFHDPHLKINNFTSTVFGRIFLISCKGKGGGEDKGEGKGNYQGQ